MEDLLKNLEWINSAATVVWIILIVIQVIVLKNLLNLKLRKHKSFKMGITLLFLVLVYPIYTSFDLQLEIGLLGNLVTLFITIAYQRVLKNLQLKENKWLIPQIVWLLVVTIYVGLMLINDYWIHA